MQLMQLALGGLMFGFGATLLWKWWRRRRITEQYLQAWFATLELYMEKGVDFAFMSDCTEVIRKNGPDSHKVRWLFKQHEGTENGNLIADLTCLARELEGKLNG